jgi:hypothetical protein
MQAYHINERIYWWVEVLKLKGQRDGQTYKRDVGAVQTGTMFGNRVISGAVDLGFRSTLYGWKVKT